MTAPKWWEGRMASLDTETTGPNPHDDHIVTAALVHHAPGARPRTMSWLIDPGVDIPAEAAAVHGWTTERLRTRLNGRRAHRITTEGREAPVTREGALFEIAAQAATIMHTDTPLIVANAPYDLTLLEAELARVGIDSLASRPSGIRGVVDPMVIEKQYDTYRKMCYRKNQETGEHCDRENGVHVCGGCRGGKHKCGGCGATDKTLGSLCTHYGLPHIGAHDASGDAIAALRVTRKLADLWPEIARWKLATLHGHQVTWRRDQANSLREYFDKNGIEHDGVDPGWPVQTPRATAEAGAA